MILILTKSKCWFILMVLIITMTILFNLYGDLLFYTMLVLSVEVTKENQI